MAGPVADKIILPLDTGNTGKKVRTQKRTVGADDVQEHFMIPISKDNIVGKYKCASTVLTIPTSAQNGTTTGLFWIYNPVGTSKLMRINRITLNSQIIALAVDLLGGEVRISRFTFTGVNSGTKLTPAKRDSNDASPIGEIATSWATAVASLVATVGSYQLQTMGLATGGAGAWNPNKDEVSPDREDDMIILRAGEGLVFWSAVAVTTTNRRLYVNGAWEEFEPAT